MTNDHNIISYYRSHVTRSVNTHIPILNRLRIPNMNVRMEWLGVGGLFLQWILCGPVEISLNKSITIIHGLKHMRSKSSTDSHSDEACTSSEHNMLMLNKDSGCLKWNHDQQQKTQGNLYANCITSNFKSFVPTQILEDTVSAISVGSRASRWF